jgi:hypothetical protein
MVDLVDDDESKEKKTILYYFLATLCHDSGAPRIFFSCVLRCISWGIAHDIQRRTQEKNILDTPLCHDVR